MTENTQSLQLFSDAGVAKQFQQFLNMYDLGEFQENVTLLTIQYVIGQIQENVFYAKLLRKGKVTPLNITEVKKSFDVFFTSQAKALFIKKALTLMGVKDPKEINAQQVYERMRNAAYLSYQKIKEYSAQISPDAIDYSGFADDLVRLEKKIRGDLKEAVSLTIQQSLESPYFGEVCKTLAGVYRDYIQEYGKGLDEKQKQRLLDVTDELKAFGRKANNEGVEKNGKKLVVLYSLIG